LKAGVNIYDTEPISGIYLKDGAITLSSSIFEIYSAGATGFQLAGGNNMISLTYSPGPASTQVFSIDNSKLFTYYGNVIIGGDCTFNNSLSGYIRSTGSFEHTGSFILDGNGYIGQDINHQLFITGSLKHTGSIYNAGNISSSVLYTGSFGNSYVNNCLSIGSKNNEARLYVSGTLGTTDIDGETVYKLAQFDAGPKNNYDGLVFGARTAVTYIESGIRNPIALGFSIHGNEAMRIKADGNVLIGTTAGNKKLVVEGEISSSDIIYTDSYITASAYKGNISASS